jgi:Flp pilus assembly protein TadG
MVAAFSVVMFALAALVVDLGIARETSREAQTAADAAALAGAGELYADDGTLRAGEAIAAVKAYVGANYGTTASDWSACSAPLGGWSQSAGSSSSGTSCIAFDSSSAPKKMRVVVPSKHTTVLFGSLIGYEGANVGARAEASAVSSDVPACTLCVLGVLDAGHSDVSITGGGSVHAGAGSQLYSNGSITVAADGTIDFTGAANPGSGPQYSPNPPVVNSGVPVRDHFENSPMPDPATVSDIGSDQVSCGPGGEDSLIPGVYHDIDIKNVTCDLADGLYVITGEFNLLSSNARVVGHHVTLFFTCGTRQSPSGCGSGSDGGRLDGDRKGLTLGAPYFGGFSLLYDRGNTSDLILSGNDGSDHHDDDDHEGTVGSASFGGSIYARNADVRIERGLVTVLNGKVVIGSLELSGSDSHLSVSAPRLTVPGPPEIVLTK